MVPAPPFVIDRFLDLLVDAVACEMQVAADVHGGAESPADADIDSAPGWRAAVKPAT
jgi:hypothetical protein